MKYENLEKFKTACSGFLAKSDKDDDSIYLPLWLHTADTAGIAEFLAQYWLSDSVKEFIEEKDGLDSQKFVQLTVFLALVHDIGKSAAFFQRLIANKVPDYRDLAIDTGDFDAVDTSRTRHNKASDYILTLFGVPDSLAALAGGHHGKPFTADSLKDIKNYKSNIYGCYDPKKYQEIWEEILDAALTITGYSSVSELPAVNMETQMILEGLLIMADWLASNSYYFPLIDVHDGLSSDRFKKRLDAAIKKIHLPDPWMSTIISMDEEVFEERFGFSPNILQKRIMEIISDTDDPGLYIIEAQMGTGKTEAALAAADTLMTKKNYGGVFFGLPTQATANGLFHRFKDWAEKEAEEGGSTLSVLLAHSKARQNPDFRNMVCGSGKIDDLETGNAGMQDGRNNSSLIVERWLSGRKLSMLPDMVIGTIDQILIACLRQKHIMLRHLGMASKIVILDEIHSYDAYTNQFLERVLVWLASYHCPVVLLSATLSYEKRKSLVAAYLQGISAANKKPQVELDRNISYPSITWTDGMDVHSESFDLKGQEKSIKIRKTEKEELSEVFEQIMKEKGPVGIIFNTVKQCQRMAEKLKSEYPDKHIIVFHARFTDTDRARIEQEVLQRLSKNSAPGLRNNVVVVGTQVLEQSLDIDFDIMVTELAPIDLLLQRMGRLYRHNRPGRNSIPVCYVVNTQADKNPSAKIYGEWLLYRTWKELPDKIAIPDDIPWLIEKVYMPLNQEKMSSAEMAMAEKAENDIQIKISKAQPYLLTAPVSRRRGKSPYRKILDVDFSGMEEEGVAVVRDGQSSLPVIMVVQDPADPDKVYIPGHPEETFSKHEVLSSNEAWSVLKGQIKLPYFFSKKENLHKVISELEERTRQEFSLWQQSPALKGELILKMDSDQGTVLCNRHLCYDSLFGLREEETGAQ